MVYRGPVAAGLDDLSLYSKGDPSGLRGRLRSFPLQCRQAWEEALAMELPGSYAQAKAVVVLGMGGSAIGGDLLADLAAQEDSPPVAVCRDYQIPGYVDSNTLVLACSYSGDTEETLSGFRQALARGAKVVALTRGGALGDEAADHGLPLFMVRYQGEPRSALGYGFVVPTVLLMKLGYLSDKTSDFEETLAVLHTQVGETAEESPSPGNRAKQLASGLLDRLILVYGAGIFGGVARRWKTQLNENSKVTAFVELLPEAHHNSVVGFSAASLASDRSVALLLKPRTLHPRLELRYQVTEELLDRESIVHETVEGRGTSALCQILSAVSLGDYVSYYLALVQGLDPSPVAAIDYIKERLVSLG